MKEHKFQIGESVYFTSRPIGHMAANSTYQVVRLLPSDGADYQYRIKNANEAFERVVRESQLEDRSEAAWHWQPQIVAPAIVSRKSQVLRKLTLG